MATTTEEYLYEPTTNMPEFSELLLGSSASSSASIQHHNQITFEIPSHRDLEHIDTLHSFNTLLQRIGNVAYDTVSTADRSAQHGHLALDAAGQPITNEQISKSVVLDLADLKDSAASGLERFFAGADMHSIINYLWIGVVTSLVILSVIFIVFSCYFYRKFREWKKCNKDIRAHLNNDMYPGGTLVPCDNGQATDAAYYQLESPPCYTIATGLPTYDEALHTHQHFSFGMKFMYPSIAAVHHHPAISGACIVSNWEKEDLTQKRKDKQSKQKAPKESALQAPPAYDAAASVALLTANEKSEAVSISMEAAAAGEEVAKRTSALSSITTNDEVDEDACSGVFVA